MSSFTKGLPVVDKTSLDPACDEHYEVAAECLNCDWYGLLRLAKGREAPKVGLGGRRFRCDRCGCHSLVKDLEDSQRSRL